MTHILQILHDATTGTSNKETDSREENEKDSVVSALTQLTSFFQKETDELDKEHVSPTRRHNISLNEFFNPPEESCHGCEDTTRKNTEGKDA